MELIDTRRLTTPLATAYGRYSTEKRQIAEQSLADLRKAENEYRKGKNVEKNEKYIIKSYFGGGENEQK